MRIRMDPVERKAQLLDAAYQIAKCAGIKAVKRVSVAEACSVTEGVINMYFGNIKGLRNEVMERAVKMKNAPLLAEASKYYTLPSMPRTLMRDVRNLWNN